MRVRRSGVLAAVTGVVSLVGLATVAPPVRADASRFVLPLSVDGNRIVDGNHNTVVLNGVHRDGPQAGPADYGPRFPSDAELAWLTTGAVPAAGDPSGAWKANIVRVPVSAPMWTGACPKLYSLDAQYRASVDAMVSSITTRGALALLDLHTVAPKCGSIGRFAMPDPDALTFWQQAAAHYAGNPLVAFELYNEPHDIDDAVWRNGTAGETQTTCTLEWSADAVTYKRNQLLYKACLNSPTTLKWQAIGMQALYDAVTAAAPGHLVVVDGPGWAGAPPAAPLSAAAGYLVYALHPYTCSDPKNAKLDCAHTEKAHANTAALGAWRTFSNTHGVPVLVTEVGWPTYPSGDGSRTDYTDGATFYSETIDFLQHPVCPAAVAVCPKWGILGFAFDGSNNGTYDLVEDTTRYDPNSTAAPLYQLLQANP
jgi:hypothetical protein